VQAINLQESSKRLLYKPYVAEIINLEVKNMEGYPPQQPDPNQPQQPPVQPAPVPAPQPAPSQPMPAGQPPHMQPEHSAVQPQAQEEMVETHLDPDEDMPVQERAEYTEDRLVALITLLIRKGLLSEKDFNSAYNELFEED